MVNLIDIARNYITPEIVSRLAIAAGMDSDLAMTALDSILPVLLAAVGNTASTPAGADTLMQAIASGKLGGNLLDSLTGATEPDMGALAAQGAPIADMLFGGAGAPASDAIARFTGAEPGGVSRLMVLLAPVALSLVSRQLSASGGTGPAAIARLFANERATILQAIPAGLRGALAAIPGLGFMAAQPAAAAAAAAVPALSTHREADSGAGIGAIVPWLLLLAGLAAMVWWLTRETPAGVNTTAADPVTTEFRIRQ